ncbi:13239_t:CDS:1, partial [Dentiscutata erythropus]
WSEGSTTSHVQQFVDRANFKTFYESLFVHYNQTVSPMLTTIFQMINLGNSSFGAPGQMVFVDLQGP